MVVTGWEEGLVGRAGVAWEAAEPLGDAAVDPAAGVDPDEGAVPGAGEAEGDESEGDEPEGDVPEGAVAVVDVVVAGDAGWVVVGVAAAADGGEAAAVNRNEADARVAIRATRRREVVRTIPPIYQDIALSRAMAVGRAAHGQTGRADTGRRARTTWEPTAGSGR